jgi:hypothetical protein
MRGRYIVPLNKIFFSVRRVSRYAGRDVRGHVGFYNFAVDIHYGFGFDLPLLFTNDEAFKTISVAKVSITYKLLRDDLNPFIAPA